MGAVDARVRTRDSSSGLCAPSGVKGGFLSCRLSPPKVLCNRHNEEVRLEMSEYQFLSASEASASTPHRDDSGESLFADIASGETGLVPAEAKTDTAEDPGPAWSAAAAGEFGVPLSTQGEVSSSDAEGVSDDE
jgi:hypothetical protein